MKPWKLLELSFPDLVLLTFAGQFSGVEAVLHAMGHRAASLAPARPMWPPPQVVTTQTVSRQASPMGQNLHWLKASVLH